MLADRVLITGGPRCGKSTLALTTALDLEVSEVQSTDTTKDMPWSEASALVATWFDQAGPWVIEGVVVPRALRKWLASHPTGKPCDRLIFLGRALQPLTVGQASMFKGVITVLAEVVGELRDRGVEIDLDGGSK